MLTNSGTGFAEFWVASVGLYVAIGGLISFSHPSYLYFITTLLTLLLLIPLLSIVLLSPELLSAHAPLIYLPATVTLIALILTLLSNYLVRRAKMLEGQRICRMLNSAASEAGDEEHMARGLVGVQGGLWKGFKGFVGGVIGLLAGLAGIILVLVGVLSRSACLLTYSS